MGDYTEGIITGLIVGLVIGVLIGSGISEHYYKQRVEQLGQSICEEEYGMDFESYYDNTLKCKPVKEKYDGIRVEVPKGVD